MTKITVEEVPHKEVGLLVALKKQGVPEDVLEMLVTGDNRSLGPGVLRRALHDAGLVRPPPHRRSRS